MFVVCDRWVDKDGLPYWPQILLSTIAVHLSQLGLGLLNHGSLRAQSPLSGAGSHFDFLSPTDSNRPGHLVILFSNVHRLPLFFLLFTQVHLLIDGSVEGQYITMAVEPITDKVDLNKAADCDPEIRVLLIV